MVSVVLQLTVQADLRLRLIGLVQRSAAARRLCCTRQMNRVNSRSTINIVVVIIITIIIIYLNFLLYSYLYVFIHQAVEKDVKSMTDNVASIRQMSEALMEAAGSDGKFREKLRVELAELSSAFDAITRRSRSHSERLLSAQQRVDIVLADIRQMESGIDELTTRLCRLDFTTAEPTSVSRLQTEFKVIFGLLKLSFSVFYDVCSAELDRYC